MCKMWAIIKIFITHLSRFLGNYKFLGQNMYITLLRSYHDVLLIANFWPEYIMSIQNYFIQGSVFGSRFASLSLRIEQ